MFSFGMVHNTCCNTVSLQNTWKNVGKNFYFRKLYHNTSPKYRDMYRIMAEMYRPLCLNVNKPSQDKLAG